MPIDFEDDVETKDLRSVILEEFPRIDIETTLSEHSIFAGERMMAEFDQAARYHLLKCGERLHKLKRIEWDQSHRDPNRDHLSIVTISSDRRLIPAHGAARAGEPYQVHHGNGGHVSGLIPHDKDFDIHGWIDDNLGHLDVALSCNPDIVSFGEFDYPMLDPVRQNRGHGREPHINLGHHTQASENVIRAFENSIMERLARMPRPTFVFAGSRHEWDVGGRDCHNRGKVFYRDIGRDILTDDKKKRISAKSLGENLTQPRHPTMDYYATAHGNVAVLICIDAYAPGIVSSHMAISSLREDKRPHVILVPSYNRSRKLLRSAQILSQLTNTVVVYINAMGGLDEHVGDDMRAQVFVSGLALEKWRTQLEAADAMHRATNGSWAPKFEMPLPMSLQDFSDKFQAAQGIRRVPINDHVTRWEIPNEFPAEAANMMDRKMPAVHRCLIANAPDDDVQ